MLLGILMPLQYTVISAPLRVCFNQSPPPVSSYFSQYRQIPRRCLFVEFKRGGSRERHKKHFFFFAVSAAIAVFREYISNSSRHLARAEIERKRCNSRINTHLCEIHLRLLTDY